VLGRYQDVINSHGFNVNSIVGIFNNNLWFQVRSQPGNSSAVSSLSNFFTNQVSEVVRIRM
jgi:hypothetical protein